ncbi:MAG: hypothetical protein M3P26_10500 [Gemmatimonadota bacterium]|nr:hypothetical protein [Gemmatimonadota bacterium]
MPEREDELADVAAQIEMLLQKWERKQSAALFLWASDPQSLDREIRDSLYRNARTLLTAAIYELADTIVNGGTHVR